MSTRLPSLDGLRAISIATVIGGHAISAYPLPKQLDLLGYFFDGSVGVRTFFVISGFLITYLLLRERNREGAVDLKAFYKRRILRIVPASYAFIAVLFAFNAWAQLSPCNFVTSLTYTKNYGCTAQIDVHLWSLSVEEQFYLLWPVIVSYLSPARCTIVAIVICFLAPIARALQYMTHSTTFIWFSHADGLMAGAILAFAVTFYPVSVKKHLPNGWQRAICILIIVATIYIPNHHLLGPLNVTIAPTMQMVAIVWLVAGVTFDEPKGVVFWVLNCRPVVYVGLLSYSLYIWQQPFFAGLPALAIPALPLIAMVSYHFWEQPIRNLGRARRSMHSRSDFAVPTKTLAR